jgi:hypothetical protein
MTQFVFEQSTGKMFDPSGEFIGIGYAGGNCGKNPEGVCNSALQASHSIGPLPQGLYSLGVAVEGSHLGAFAIPLIPDAKNEMFGRSAFYCHGDNSAANQSASEGCVVIAPSIRHMIYNSTCKQIRVVAVFSK